MSFASTHTEEGSKQETFLPVWAAHLDLMGASWGDAVSRKKYHQVQVHATESEQHQNRTKSTCASTSYLRGEGPADPSAEPSLCRLAAWCCRSSVSVKSKGHLSMTSLHVTAAERKCTLLCLDTTLKHTVTVISSTDLKIIPSSLPPRIPFSQWQLLLICFRNTLSGIFHTLSRISVNTIF